MPVRDRSLFWKSRSFRRDEYLEVNRMHVRVRSVLPLAAAGMCLTSFLLSGIVANAAQREGAQPGHAASVDRLENEHLKLATRKVGLDVGDRRDMPWMSGEVLIEVQIDESGCVDDARALFGDSTLIDLAIRAARQWEFRPYVTNGRATRVRTAIRFDVTPFDSDLGGPDLEAIAERELALRPDSAVALYNCGYASSRFRNHHWFALAYFQRAIALKPDWALAWYELGHAHYGRDQFEEALRAYERALELDPKLFAAALETGWCQDRMEPPIDSCAAYERAARLAKSANDRVAALMNLFQSYFRAGRLRESADARFEMARDMRRSCGIDPSASWNVVQRAYDAAKDYERIGELDRMAEVFTFAMETSEGSYFGMLSRVELAEHLQATGREAEARQQFENILRIVRASERGSGVARDRDTRAVRRHWNAWALFGLGRTKEALGEARKAVGLKPDWDRARYLLGRVYERLGERKKAAEEYLRSGLVEPVEIKQRGL